MVSRRHDNEFENTSGNESEDVPSDQGKNNISNHVCNDEESINRIDMEAADSSLTNNRQTGFNTFFGDEPGCVKRFVRFQNLVNHHARGDHVFKPDKVKLRDKAIQLFKSGVEQKIPIFILFILHLLKQ